MRRVAVLLAALFLVNLPYVNATLTDREVTRRGQEVSATVLDARRLGGNGYLDFRLPRSADPQGRRFSAQVDDTTYAAATQARAVEVRVVPGKPSHNRVVGQVDGPLFAIVALVSDLFIAAAAVIFWRRRRKRVHEVVEVGTDQDTVVLRREQTTLTVTAPERWLQRARPGLRCVGSLHLVAGSDVLPRGGEPGFDQILDAAYVVRGRVLDVRAGRVRLDAGGGQDVSVQTGPHKIRADIREIAEVSGTLCFTPS